MSEAKKVVISVCYGGFGLSDAAYERLIALGVPVRAYVQQRQGDDGRYLPEPQNDGEVIFDREMEPARTDDRMWVLWRGARDRGDRSFWARYWDCWTRDNREHPLLVRVVEEMGEAANGPHAKLKVVEIPSDVEYVIDEYDGYESIHEAHRSWS